MAIDKKSLMKLRNALPKGFGKILKNRLEEQHHLFAPVYIYQCLDPNNKRYNDLIINEAIELIFDIKKKDRSVEDQIDSYDED